MADKAARGHGEAYGKGTGFRVRGMSKAEVNAAVALAKAVNAQNGTFAQKVGRLRGKLRR